MKKNKTAQIFERYDWIFKILIFSLFLGILLPLTYFFIFHRHEGLDSFLYFTIKIIKYELPIFLCIALILWLYGFFASRCKYCGKNWSVFKKSKTLISRYNVPFIYLTKSLWITITTYLNEFGCINCSKKYYKKTLNKKLKINKREGS